MSGLNVLSEARGSVSPRFQIARVNTNKIHPSNYHPARRVSSTFSPISTVYEEEDYSHCSLNNNNFEMAGRKASLAGRRKSSHLPDLEEYQGNNTIGVYGKSLANYTQDALPKMENYRNMMSLQAASRPTIDELHDHTERQRPKGGNSEDALPANAQVKFGWIEGCLVRCLLNIWGVMLFLRLSWMVAHSGIIHALIIIVISTIVTTITTLSMSAVSTNGEIKGGGLYYMISRSLGPECGGAIGVVFSFANSAMASLNTVGFSESMISLLKVHDLKIVDGHINDIRIISCIALCVMQAVILIGMEWEAKAQMGLLVILLVAMLDFVIGAFMGPQRDEQIAKGFVGLNVTVLEQNLGPGYRFAEGIQQDFFTIFALFFPSVAGIQAGASISGDLKDPGGAIPKGTLLAIFITSGSYIIFAVLAGAGTLREATGNSSQVADWSFEDCRNQSCTAGLYNDFNVMELMSLFGPLIYAGCFAATLSSALSCLVSGPKTFQALCKDPVYPYMSKFGKGFGKADDPYWSYAIGFVVALIFILIGDINTIAPLISNFFMVAYAILNFCAFHASIVKPLGWRPTFKYYNCWVSLFGAIACVVIMFLMEWKTALVSLGCAIILYLIVVYRKPDVNWGTSSQAATYNSALHALHSLANQSEHAKNYRPQILVLCGHPYARPILLDFANLLTKNNSLLLCGGVMKQKIPARVRGNLVAKAYEYLDDHDVRGFVVLVDNEAFDDGAQALFQAAGIGKLAPNIILFGYKANWQTCEPREVREYFHALHEALDNYMAIAILRVKGGCDVSSVDGSDKIMEAMGKSPSTVSQDGKEDQKSSDTVEKEKRANEVQFNGKKQKKKDKTPKATYKSRGNSGEPIEIAESYSYFSAKQGKGTIDVWWLYDDGGLTLLLPYIISTRKNWESCKLRVFTLANKKAEMEKEHISMAGLLSKFRIDYSDLTVIPDITARAEGTTRAFFDALIKNKRAMDPEEVNEDTIGESELGVLKEKTNRHLRLRELLLKHSSNSNLIVMTLPVPRRGGVSAPLYMAWLETITRDMPPFLLVRGNQSSVLTFYS